MADPSDRAGLTDAPLRVASAKWMATSVNGIASAASAGARLVDTRITSRKIAVKTVSRIRAPISVIPVPGLVIPFATVCWLTATAMTAAAPIAPRIWAMM